MYYILVVSDGTGRTAQQALSAALTQFADTNPTIIVRSGIRTEEQIDDAVSEAMDKEAFIVHTLVSDHLRSIMVKTARVNNVDTIDLMGPFLIRLSEQFANAPSGKPGLFHELNKDYFRRIETMEYAFKHDDGMRIHELDKAEIVLLGVSRTFKTPLSLYLAIKGWFVANVPIIYGNPPDPILYEIEARRVFCLTSYPSSLSRLRRTRHEHLGGQTGDYANPDYVKKELRFAQDIYDRQPAWHIVNVTSKSIEEIASEILSILGRRKLREFRSP